MKELIEALQMFLAVRDIAYPTHCEHDEMWICGYALEDFTPEQVQHLDDLGFFWDEDDESFKSFKYGSA